MSAGKHLTISIYISDIYAKRLYDWDATNYGIDLDTFYLTNKNTGNADRIPLIKRVTPYNRDCTDSMPKVSNLEIVLDNRPGTLGYERKISDHFERFTLIDQRFQLKVFEDDIGSFTNVNAGSNPKTILYLTCKNYRIDTKAQEFTLVCESYTAITQPLCHVLSNSTSLANFLSFNSKCHGKALPFLLGENIYSKLIPMDGYVTTANNITSSPIGTSNVHEMHFGYCTGRLGHSPNAPSNWYIRTDIRNQYKEFTPTTTPNTVDSQYTQAPAFVANVSIDTDTEVCELIKFPGTAYTSARVITGGNLELRGSATYAGAVNGTVTIKIYRENETNIYSSSGTVPANDPIATATIDKNDYAASFNTNTTFTVAFQLDKPVWVDNQSSSALYFSVSHSDDSTAATNYLNIRTGTGSSFRKFRRKIGQPWRRRTTTELMIHSWYILGAAMYSTPITADENGNEGYIACVGMRHLTASNQNPCDISNLDIVVKASGLKDNSSGTYTGVANATITKITEMLHFLHAVYYPDFAAFSAAFNRAFYSDNNVNATDSAQPYYRTLSINISGQATADNVIREICRQGKAAIVPVANNASPSFGCWVHGSREPVGKYITDDDIISSKFEFKDSKSIVNFVKMVYQPNILEVEATDIIQRREGVQGFSGFLKSADALTKSIEVFGSKTLENTTFSYVNDSTSASNLASLILKMFAMPASFFMVELPLSKYWDLELFSAVQVMSPRFPSYYGASANPRNFSYSNAESETAGVEEARGEYITGLIEGIEQDFNADKVPTVKITCRVLKYPHPAL